MVTRSGKGREKWTAEQIREKIERGEFIVCMSRCLVCARQTPHELCSDHEDHEKWPEDLDSAWGTGYDKEPETCDAQDCKRCRGE